MKLKVRFVPVLLGMVLAAIPAIGGLGMTYAQSDAVGAVMLAGVENEIGWP